MYYCALNNSYSLVVVFVHIYVTYTVESYLRYVFCGVFEKIIVKYVVLFYPPPPFNRFYSPDIYISVKGEG